MIYVIIIYYCIIILYIINISLEYIVINNIFNFIIILFINNNGKFKYFILLYDLKKNKIIKLIFLI